MNSNLAIAATQDDSLDSLIDRVEKFVAEGEELRGLLHEIRELRADTQAPDDAKTPIAAEAPIGFKDRLFSTLESAEFQAKVNNTLADLAENRESFHEIRQFVDDEIANLRSLFEPIDDEEELQYLVALSYAAMKADWMMLNTAVNYQTIAGKFDVKSSYKNTVHSLLIQVLEDFAHPPTVQKIIDALAQPFAG